MHKRLETWQALLVNAVNKRFGPPQISRTFNLASAVLFSLHHFPSHLRVTCQVSHNNLHRRVRLVVRFYYEQSYWCSSDLLVLGPGRSRLERDKGPADNPDISVRKMSELSSLPRPPSFPRLTLTFPCGKYRRIHILRHRSEPRRHKWNPHSPGNLRNTQFSTRLVRWKVTSFGR